MSTVLYSQIEAASAMSLNDVMQWVSLVRDGLILGVPVLIWNWSQALHIGPHSWDTYITMKGSGKEG